MEKEEEEKIEQIHRKRRRQSSSSSLPLDVLSEILFKLPMKSVIRSRCVSKLWSSITTDPYFAHTFNTRFPKKPSLLLYFKIKKKLFVFSIPQDQCRLSSFQQHVDSYYITYPKKSTFSREQSIHGLICFPTQSKPMIWNPTTRQFMTLPKPEKSNITCFLGYDPTQGKHKVVCFPFDETTDECYVHTLGLGQESWRKIKTNHKHRPYTDSSHECIGGVLYYLAAKIDDVDIIMSFDVRSEKFHMIKLPWNSYDGDGMLIPYKGKLACFDEFEDNGTTLWILGNEDKHDWSCLHFSAPSSYYYRKLKTVFVLRGITEDGKLFYAPSSFLKSFYILYYDPKRNRFTKAEVKGIADDEFRLKHGLVNKRLPKIHTVVSHIESLTTL